MYQKPVVESDVTDFDHGRLCCVFWWQARLCTGNHRKYKVANHKPSEQQG
jgi:hypothetical protein